MKFSSRKARVDTRRNHRWGVYTLWKEWGIKWLEEPPPASSIYTEHHDGEMKMTKSWWMSHAEWRVIDLDNDSILTHVSLSRYLRRGCWLLPPRGIVFSLPSHWHDNAADKLWEEWNYHPVSLLSLIWSPEEKQIKIGLWFWMVRKRDAFLLHVTPDFPFQLEGKLIP